MRLYRVVNYSVARGFKKCLLLEYHVTPSKMELTFSGDYPLACGPEEVDKCLSENFGYVKNAVAFIRGMEKSHVEKLVKNFKRSLSETIEKMDTPGKETLDIVRLERSILNGGFTKASIHLCDTGKRGNVENVYASSRYFDFSRESGIEAE